MQETNGNNNPPNNFGSPPSWFAVFSRKNLAILLMGIASGIPLALSGGTLQAWLLLSGFSLSAIGAFAFIGLPYALKFLWAPLFDLPSLRAISRARFVCFFALLTAALLVGLAFADPASGSTAFTALLFAMVFSSATLDIVVDALRADVLDGPESGSGVATGVLGYRLGMILSGAGGLIAADYLGFPAVYLGSAAILGVLSVSPFLLRRVEPSGVRGGTFFEPLLDLIQRKEALSLLAFVFLYKAGDALAGGMTIPFLHGLNVSISEIGFAVKTVGVAALIAGSILAGVLMTRLTLQHALVGFGVAQLVSTGGYYFLAASANKAFLLPVVAVEYFCAGLGTSALLALLIAVTDRRFSAGQYALLSALVAFGRLSFEGVSGYIAEHLGWPSFFLCSAGLALPAIFLVLYNFEQWQATVFRHDDRSPNL